MKTTRRRVLQGGAAAAALATFGIRTRRSWGQSGVVRFVPHGDVRSLDPIWTTANMSAYHGAMVYDTLFGIDANLEPQPQMVESWQISDDQLTYSFTLRDGLKWHDGTPVTAEDCVASLYRWAARDGGGQHMMRRVKEIVPTGEGSFEFRLNEPYGLVIPVLAKTSTPICYMMRKQEAATDPNEQVTNMVGSGPFRFVEDEWAAGLTVRLWGIPTLDGIYGSTEVTIGSDGWFTYSVPLPPGEGGTVSAQVTDWWNALSEVVTDTVTG